MIIDLSSPEGASVNDFIDSFLCYLSYASVDDAASFVYMQVKAVCWQNWILNLPIKMCQCIQKTTICWAFIGRDACHRQLSSFRSLFGSEDI